MATSKDIISLDIETVAKSIEKDAKKLEGKTILISGGAGFLGNYFTATIRYLNEHKFKKLCKVISLDNYITGTRKDIQNEGEDKTVKYIHHNVIKPYRTNRKIDYIIHAAGIASPIYYRRSPLETIDVTIQGVRNLLELARKKNVKSFLYFSSSEIYGNPEAKFIPTPETYKGSVSSIGPRSPYDESKRLGETICQVYYELYNTPVKMVRPFNVYGPGMKPKDYRVLPMFLSQAIAGEPLPVHEPGLQTRTFCYITDATTAFFKVLLSDRNGEVYNVGNDQDEISMMKLAEEFTKLYGRGAKIKKVPYPKSYPADEPMRRCPSLTKISKDIGFRPRVSLAKGLARYIEWYRETYEN